jgi:hypothetical protein
MPLENANNPLCGIASPPREERVLRLSALFFWLS